MAVTSVNGKTGDVVLNPEDIGLDVSVAPNPDTTPIRTSTGHIKVADAESNDDAVSLKQTVIRKVEGSSGSAYINIPRYESLDNSTLEREVDEKLRWAINFEKKPWKARCKEIISGATEFLKLDSPTDSILVNGGTFTALTSALDIASDVTSTSSARYVRLTQNITGVDATFDIPEGVTLIGDGYKITGVVGGNFAIRINNYSRVICVELENLILQLNGSTGASYFELIGNKGGMGGNYNCLISDPGSPSTNRHHHGLIALNDAYEANYLLLGININHTRIIANFFRKTSTDPVSRVYTAGRLLELNGGKFNEIAYNIQRGGIVGVGIAVKRNRSIGWYNNNIHNNWIEFVSEEGISQDIIGNSQPEMGLFDQLVPTRTQGTISSNPQIVFTKAGGFNITYEPTPGNPTMIQLIPAQAALLVMNGPLAGKYIRFIQINNLGSSEYGFQLRNNSITASELTALAAAEISIVTRCESNVIANNHLVNVRDPIKFWGSGWHCIVLMNKVIRTANYPNDKVQEVSITGISGINPLGCTTLHKSGAIPSNNSVIGNSAKCGFSGQTYGDPIVETYFSSVPNYVSNNKEDLPVEPFKKYNNGVLVWTGTTPVTILEVGSTTFNPTDARGAYSPAYSRQAGQLRKIQVGTPPSGLTSASATFSFYHGLEDIPSSVILTPRNEASALKHWVTVDSARVTVNYAEPQIAGTILSYFAELSV